MTLKLPDVSSLTSRLSPEPSGLSIGDERSVCLTNTAVNVENSTVHIGNVIHHHVHIPPELTQARQDGSCAHSGDEYCPEKSEIIRDEPRNKFDILLNNKRICIITTLIFVATLLAVLFLLLAFTHVPFEPKTTPEEAKDDEDIVAKPSESFGNLTTLAGCRIFEEETWGIKRNLGDMPLKHPVPLVIISHSSTPFCNSTKACRDRMANIQEYHIGKGSPDIGYNFMVGGDGNIYVGRGWNARNFHLGNHSIGIDLIGNFFRDEFTPKMIKCVKAVIEFGLENKILEDDYKVVCHNQTNQALASPGPNVYGEVKTWPHFMDGTVSRNYLYGV